jgi:electron transfer flavoprotein beta subunit
VERSVHVVVCVKEIPDPEIAASVFRVDEEACRVIPLPGLPFVVNPFDEQAIEAALRLRDGGTEARISSLCLGAQSARAIIKNGLALGADEAFLLSDPAFDDGDGFTTALALSRAIAKIGDVDLVLAGRQAADGDAGIVGSGIAELLDLPAVTFAGSLLLDDGSLVVERVLDDSGETVATTLPAVVTIAHELGRVRHASLRETMKAARKPITEWTAADLDLSADQVGAAGARRVLERLYVPVNDIVCEFIGGDDADGQATALLDRLLAERVLEAP